jgi:hypothetical protein
METHTRTMYVLLLSAINQHRVTVAIIQVDRHSLRFMDARILRLNMLLSCPF